MNLESRAVAVVFIHGIGDITPGDVLGSSVKALKEHLGVAAGSVSPVTSRVQRAGASGHATVRKADVKWSSWRIDLVEFNWTTVTGKIRLGRPIDAIRKLLGVLRDVPALAGIGSASSTDRAFLSICGRLYQGIFVVLALVVLSTFAHELARLGAYRDAILPFSTLHVRDETAAEGLEVGMEVLRVFGRQDSVFPDAVAGVLWGALLSFSMLPLALAAYAIVRALQGFRLRRASLVLLAAGVGWVLTGLASWSLVMAGIGAFQLSLMITELQTSLSERLVVGMLFAGIAFWLPGKVAIALGNLMRDVVHYLAPDRRGALTPNQLAIRTELWQVINDLQTDGRYARIVLIAHSLGTVILTDVLLERAPSVAVQASTSLDLITAGSPLRRLVHRFFPDRTAELLTVRRRLRDGPGLRVERWFNAYRLADYVGQALTRSAFLLDLVGWRWSRGDPQTGVRDHLLTPRYRWPLAHANYWGDVRFARFVALEVVRPILDSRPSTGRGA